MIGKLKRLFYYRRFLKLSIMQIDITFDFAKVFDVKRLHVAKGQTFAFHVPHHYRVFSDNDEVLDVRGRTGKIEVTAASEGHCTLLFLNREFEIRKHLSVRVVASVQPQAGDLNPSADSPIPK